MNTVDSSSGSSIKIDDGSGSYVLPTETNFYHSFTRGNEYIACFNTQFSAIAKVQGNANRDSIGSSSTSLSVLIGTPR